MIDYRKYLSEDVLRFWLEHGIDDEHGGIITQLDRYGNVIDDKKSVIFIGRSLWTYAMAYRLLEPKEEYLDVCEKLAQFYDKCEMPDGGLPRVVNRDGTAQPDAINMIHSQIHAAMGLAQYYRICHQAAVWQKAQKYYCAVETWYREHRSKKKTASGVTKGFGLNFLVLSMAQFMRNVGIDSDRYDALIRITLDELMNGGYVDEENGAVFELLSEKGERISSLSCPGHVYEASWFVMCEGEVKNDDTLRMFGRKLCDYAMPRGFEEHGVFAPTSRDVVKQPYGDSEDNYAWWTQCEAIITYRLAYNIFGEKAYWDLAERIEKATFDAFADKQHGEWYSEVFRNGQVADDNKGSLIKGPFHLPRMLLALMSMQETGNILSYMA